MMSRSAYGLDTIPADSWRDAAACTLNDAPLFDVIAPKGGQHQPLTTDNQTALAMCRRCPVQTNCLNDAIQHPTEYRIIAGGHVIHRGHVITTTTTVANPKPGRPVKATSAEVLALHNEGRHTIDGIAALLGLHPKTVRRHIRRAQP